MFSWGARSREKSAPAAASAPLIVETISASRALPKFIAALATQPTPTLLDLGPVVGANVSFFGERLSCKMLIEDLHEFIDAQMKITYEDPNAFGNALAARVAEVAPDQVDGILCWDIFDYLDRRAARALATGLRQILRPRGVLHGFFGTTPGDFNYRTRFVVQSETSVKCRCEPARPTRRQPLQSGEIARFFEPLSIVESVLLQSKTREALFRQPG
jgi:hypothetical protein